MIVQIQRLDKGLPLPDYAIQGDAGMDVYSAIDCTIAPGERAVVPTGIAIALPEGYVCFAHPRSGLAAKHGISIVNAPGTIDSGYRGEIKIILINTDAKESFEVKRGDRELVLTKTEFDLLELLMQRPNTVVTREQIYESIWGYDFETSSKSLDVYIGYLRRKTEENGESRIVYTVRGVGYTVKES